MKVEKRELLTEENESYTIYDMTNSRGLTVSVMTLGAGIERILLTDKGREYHLALGFTDVKHYRSSECFAGATLGPNAGRIRNGELPVDQKLFLLSQNSPGCQLHGGANNLSFSNWDTVSVSSDFSSARLKLSASQPDGLDGYPGNRRYDCTYSLEDTNWLSIEYYATTDRPTYINMSNHTYWNLSGNFDIFALNQKLQIFANNVCINTPDHIPEDIIPVADTAFDFRDMKKISSAIQSADDSQSLAQLQMSRGYNHAYLLNKNDSFRKLRTVKHTEQLKKACILKDADSDRTLKMFTDAPTLVLYSGGYLPTGFPLHDGAFSSPSCGIALEALDVPDVMHLLPSSYVLTTPERPFRRTIRFHVS